MASLRASRVAPSSVSRSGPRPALAPRPCRSATVCRATPAEKKAMVEELERQAAAARSHLSETTGGMVKVSLESVDVADDLPTLLEVDKDSYYPTIEANKDKLVVVDVYTDWCGPCKMILPAIRQMQADMPEIKIVKFNANKYNKDLGKALGVKVAPTFYLYKGGEKVAEMTGAKLEQLQALIAKHK